MDKIIWKPTPELLTRSYMAAFMQFISHETALDFSNYFELQKWSVEQNEKFWDLLWDFCQIRGEKKSPFLNNGANFEKSVWFQNSSLNFVENLLWRCDDHPALISVAENGSQKILSYRNIYEQVAILQGYLLRQGLKAGDRVAACLPNRAETIIAMLASTSLGAIWSSCSPDFGLPALVDRFSQIEPKILFATDFHEYNGKQYSHKATIEALQQKLPSVKKIIVVPFYEELKVDFAHIKNLVFLSASSSCGSSAGSILMQDGSHEPVAERRPSGNLDFQSHQELIFPKFPFNHPLYILYSSGTTGKPKCMVHGAGGTLLQHAKELMLHVDLHPEDRIFFYTTCGWMMWNWFVSSLKVGATLILYDGSPFYPKPDRLFTLSDEYKINIFGIGAKFMESCEKQQLIPKKTHSLKSLKTFLTTGSPLLPESFDYIHEKINSNARISSISGGSDIISCFALGNPILPVYRGQIQCLGLGMAVSVFDEKGQSIVEKTGELVCTKTFPSKPIYFWNDPEGKKFHDAYFAQYSNIWAHGDYAQLTKEDGLIIYGRSDATLNPGGIRIGTAEIYNQLEKIDEILDALAVGQEWEGSERIILFVILAKEKNLDEELITKIKSRIRENTSPHHVPHKIIAVPDLPKTLNGKLAELAVKNIIHNRLVKNQDALLNPESLNYFKNIPELFSG